MVWVVGNMVVVCVGGQVGTSVGKPRGLSNRETVGFTVLEINGRFEKRQVGNTVGVSVGDAVDE